MQKTFRHQTIRRKRVRAGAALCFLLLISSGLPAGRANAVEAPPKAREISRVTFAVAGDVIPHQAVVQSAAAQDQAAKSSASAQGGTDLHGGWDALFASVADVFRHADFGFVNLETPVAPNSSRGSKPFQFDAPIALVQSLKASGVRIVSFANNHVFDQGQPGFAETLQHLKEEGLLFAKDRKSVV